ncbi:MAG: hypothetical protein MUC60_04510 [Oscillatoria sp. Prado101]|nr:hypothetical protein [Oscillatoria sp. Prado101]
MPVQQAPQQRGVWDGAGVLNFFIVPPHRGAGSGLNACGADRISGAGCAGRGLCCSTTCTNILFVVK